jgi:hypothetical protein
MLKEGGFAVANILLLYRKFCGPKKDFSQLEDFNKKVKDKKYDEYFEAVFRRFGESRKCEEKSPKI